MNENKEMSDNAFWVLIVSVVTVCITALLLGMVAADVIVTKLYIAAGYTQTTLPGHSAIVWVKEAK